MRFLLSTISQPGLLFNHIFIQFPMMLLTHYVLKYLGWEMRDGWWWDDDGWWDGRWDKIIIISYFISQPPSHDLPSSTIIIIRYRISSPLPSLSTVMIKVRHGRWDGWWDKYFFSFSSLLPSHHFTISSLTTISPSHLFILSGLVLFYDWRFLFLLDSSIFTLEKSERW